MKVSLRKVRKSDLKFFSKWWKDKTLAQLTSGVVASSQEIKKYFEKILQNKNNFHFMISANSQIIGHLSLIKRKGFTYETQIVIGEKKYWNHGYGTIAIQKVLKKAKKFHVKKVYLRVRVTNLRAIRSYEKSGFLPKETEKKKKESEFLKMEIIIK